MTSSANAIIPLLNIHLRTTNYSLFLTTKQFIPVGDTIFMSKNNNFDSSQEEIYAVLLELLHSIKQGDAKTYTRLCSSSLSCIEPETGGSIVHGLDFHLFLIERTVSTDYHIEIIDPVIRVYGDTAYVAYILTNSFWSDTPSFNQVQETRIFNKENGLWKMVHFHRSAL